MTRSLEPEYSHTGTGGVGVGTDVAGGVVVGDGVAVEVGVADGGGGGDGTPVGVSVADGASVTARAGTGDGEGADVAVAASAGGRDCTGSGIAVGDGLVKDGGNARATVTAVAVARDGDCGPGAEEGVGVAASVGAGIA